MFTILFTHKTKNHSLLGQLSLGCPPLNSTKLTIPVPGLHPWPLIFQNPVFHLINILTDFEVLFFDVDLKCSRLWIFTPLTKFQPKDTNFNQNIFKLQVLYWLRTKSVGILRSRVNWKWTAQSGWFKVRKWTVRNDLKYLFNMNIYLLFR